MDNIKKLYHKCSLDNLDYMLSNDRDFDVCCSSDASTRLFNHNGDRNICIEITVSTEEFKNAFLSDVDADAGKNYGYDEYRIIINMKNNNIKVYIQDQLKDNMIDGIYGDYAFFMVEDHPDFGRYSETGLSLEFLN